MTYSQIVIRAGREKPIRNQHPWVFSGAIEKVRGNPTPGEIVDVVSHKGDFLARGYWNAKSQIQVRILTWEDEPINHDWWRKMLERAYLARQPRIWAAKNNPTNAAFRVVNAENDFIPGLIVDRYGDWLVLQALTLGIDQRKKQIAELLAEITGVRGIYERSDVDVRRKEGLQEVTGVLWGEAPPELIEVRDDGPKILVDVYHGHKTGFYLDQAPNRWALVNLLAQRQYYDTSPLTMLNLFSYTGTFGLRALAYGATHVINVDASHEALELSEKIYGEVADKAEFIQANVFDYIRDQAEEGAQYDIVICDPPKFAQNARQVEGAARGYKDLNLYSFRLVKPGGYLLTFSCSAAITRDLFQKIVFGALADSGRQAQIIRHLSASEDHPVALTFPEGEYLKGLLLRVY